MREKIQWAIDGRYRSEKIPIAIREAKWGEKLEDTEKACFTSVFFFPVSPTYLHTFSTDRSVSARVFILIYVSFIYFEILFFSRPLAEIHYSLIQCSLFNHSNIPLMLFTCRRVS